MTNDLDLKPYERRIKHAVDKLTTEIKQLEKQIEKLKETRRQIQSFCSHRLTERIPDPAGGYADNECLICGKVGKI